MSEIANSSTSASRKRPEFRNLSLFSDLRGYRLPIAGLVSILHRVSGAVIFVLLPFIIWLLDTSTSSEASFNRFSAVFTDGAGFLPWWLIKLVVLVLMWAFLHHLCAGVRHLWMDLTHHATKEFGKNTGLIVLGVSLLLTVVLGLKLFGVY